MTLRLKPSLLLSVALAGLGCHRSDFPVFPDGFREFAYVANAGSNTVTVLDLVYLRVDRTLRVGANPSEVLASPTRPEVYVLNREIGGAAGSITILNTDRNEVAATLPVHRDPVGLSVDRTGHRAYVANAGSNTLSVLDLDTRRPLATLATTAGPGSALISPDGRTLVVTYPASGAVSLYSAAPSTPGNTGAALTLRNTFQGCPGATSPVILPDSSKAFIACPSSNQVLALSLALEPSSWGARHDASLTSDRALTLLDVGLEPTHLILKPDGGEIFVTNAAAGSITEISTTTNEVTSTFGIGNKPAHGIVSADNSALWVSNAGADVLSLYSIDDGKRLPSVHVGAAPDALAFTTGKDQHFLLVADRLSGDVAILRNSATQAPTLLTMLPAGRDPAAIAIRSNSPVR